MLCCYVYIVLLQISMTDPLLTSFKISDRYIDAYDCGSNTVYRHVNIRGQLLSGSETSSPPAKHET
jgi:hypothetical protein